MANETRINPNLNPQTQINREILRSETRIDPDPGSSDTVINPVIRPDDRTRINPELPDHGEIRIDPAVFGITGDPDQLTEGSLLLGRYTIEKKLDIPTGEADIYICSYDGSRFAAKIYRRDTAIKPDVVEAIRQISSPYVAKICEVGTIQGRTVEILPYYPKGSLARRTFSYQEIRWIIVCLNEALHALHQIKVIHKDLKPSNIMLWDDESGVSVIDFGISSVTRDGQTILVTKTGMTPEYSAPETIHNVFLEESDYYSLGITLYELFSGTTPYAHLSTEEIARYMLVQQFPFPREMPEDLVRLIKGLTYTDITHRNEPHNPNRRWTYLDVVAWCQGNPPPVPGESTAVGEIPMRPYPFRGGIYRDMRSLCKALAANWKMGKKELYRGSLSVFFKNFNPEVAGICMDAEEAAEREKTREDFYFFDLIYKLCPGMEEFYWKEAGFRSLEEFGQDILRKLRTRALQSRTLWDEILSEKILSCYLSLHAAKLYDPGVVSWLERRHTAAGISGRERMLNYWLVGYTLSGERSFQYGGRTFSSVTELSAYLKDTAGQSFAEMEKAAAYLIHPETNELLPQLEAWLTILGYGRLLGEWQSAYTVRRGING